MFITCYSFGQVQRTTARIDSLTKASGIDSLRKKPVAAASDSTIITKDSLRLPASRDSLDAPVNYEAQDSGVLDIPNRKLYLYGKAHTTYQTLDLKAGVIELDNQNNVAKAFFSRDSTGKVLDRPVLVDGEMTSESDSMFYNFKSQKGLTKSTYTKQGEMFVYAERIKKISASSFFASKGRFSTCNLDTPHFSFRSPRLKLITNKWAYSGVAYPEFEGVPLPVGLPFGIFPLSQGRHSGILVPTLSTTESFGIGLEGLGYYKVLNDYFDLTLRTSIYSYGGYTLSVNPNYRVRYKYSGGLRLNYQNTRINFKGDPDFVNTKTYNIAWTHNMDSKARPGTTFGANVNFGSVKFNQLVPNNSQINFTNTIYSTIQYSKTWGDGRYNLSTTANHTQNNQTGQYDITLPNLNFTVNTVYPFQKKESIGSPKWWEKLGIGYAGQFQNRVSFFDSDDPYLKYNIGEILDTMQWGAQHALPINVSLPPLGPVTFSPGINYNERWYGQKVLRTWNDATQKVDTLISKGFFTARDISFGLGAQTAIFGTVNFKGNGRVRAIRHVMRPTVSANYRPNLSGKDYYTTQINKQGDTDRFSVFEGSVYAPFSDGDFGGLSFGLQNNLEMKVRSKKDTTAGATEKIRLLDNLNITSGYNFLDTAFQLLPFNIVAGTNIFEKINITGQTSLDPYKEDSLGRRVNEFVWTDGAFKLGRLVSGSLSANASFQSKQKKQDDKKDDEEDNSQFVTPEEMQRQQDYIRSNPAEFADFNVPWTLQVGYSLSFSRIRKADLSGYETKLYSSVNLNGDFNLTPKWKMGGSIFYDINTTSFQNVTMFLSRELHCWMLSINIVPVGIYRSFNISISPRSGILRDLKVNRTRTFYN